MPSYQDEDDAEENLDTSEDPDPSDIDSEDGPALVPCPYCKKLISEDTEICHLCGSYISQEDARQPVPRWIWVGTILALIGMLWWAIAFIWKGLTS
jgi:hypothetical protein